MTYRDVFRQNRAIGILQRGLTVDQPVHAYVFGGLEGLWPDLTIILDVDLKTAAQRLKRELDRMERKGDGYHSRVREGFLKLAEGRSDFVVVDATGSVETIHREVVTIIQKWPWPADREHG